MKNIPEESSLKITFCPSFCVLTYHVVSSSQPTTELSLEPDKSVNSVPDGAVVSVNTTFVTDFSPVYLSRIGIASLNSDPVAN